MIKKLYPGGKKKAFNITYDDGVIQDIRFIDLLDRYSIKGTFNLNSQLMAEEFEWIHQNGMTVKRISPDRARTLYRNHEVASHSLTHPYMHNMSKEELMYQLGNDKKNLEQLMGREVTGFAVPFSYYSSLIADCARECGFEYSRCSDESYSYTPPSDFYHWTAGAYHINPQWRKFADRFFSADDELALCQIVGHSYDLDAENMWEEMENLLKRISLAEDVVSMTNGRLVRYLKAMGQSKITSDGIFNESNEKLWFEADGKTICIEPGGYFSL